MQPYNIRYNKLPEELVTMLRSELHRYPGSLSGADITIALTTTGVDVQFNQVKDDRCRQLINEVIVETVADYEATR